MKQIVIDIEQHAEKRDANRQMKPGKKCIGEGYDPHRLDVAEMVFGTWKDVTQQKIVRCWVKSDVLQLEMQATLTAEHGKMRSRRIPFEQKVLDEITSMMKCLSVNVSNDDCLSIYRDSYFSSDAIERWIDVEEHGAVREGIVNDAMDDLLKDSFELWNASIFSSDDRGNGTNNGTVVPVVPSSLQIAEMFSTCSRTCCARPAAGSGGCDTSYCSSRHARRDECSAHV